MDIHFTNLNHHSAWHWPEVNDITSPDPQGWTGKHAWYHSAACDDWNFQKTLFSILIWFQHQTTAASWAIHPCFVGHIPRRLSDLGLWELPIPKWNQWGHDTDANLNKSSGETMGCQQLVFSDTKQNPTRKHSKEILNATTWLFFKKNIHSISKTLHISLHCRSHIGPFQVRKSHNFSSNPNIPTGQSLTCARMPGRTSQIFSSKILEIFFCQSHRSCHWKPEIWVP